MPPHHNIGGLRDVCVERVCVWLVGLVRGEGRPSTRAAQRKEVTSWLSAGIRQEVLNRVLRQDEVSMDVKWQLVHLLADKTTTTIDVTGCGTVFVDEVFNLYRSLTLALSVNISRLGINCDVRSRRDQRHLPDVNVTLYRTLRLMKNLTWVTLAGLADTTIMEALATTCPHLHYLDVSCSPRLFDAGVAALLLKEPDIVTTLSVTQVAEITLTTTPCCSTLSKVCVADSEVGVVGGVLLLRCLPHLTSLGGYIGEGHPISAVIEPMLTASTMKGPETIPNGVKSSIWQCGMTEVWEPRVLNSQAALLCATCPSLTALTTEERSIPALSLLPLLTSLTIDLHFCIGSGGRLLEYLSDYGGCLTHLHLTNAKNSYIHLPALVTATPHLTHLQACLTLESGWDGYGEGEMWRDLLWASVSVTNVKTAVTLLTHTPSLTHLTLNLDPEPYTETWHDLDDGVISQITAAGGLVALQYLVVWECGVSLTGITTLLHNCPALSYIAPLLNWSKVTPQDIDHLRKEARDNNWVLKLRLRHDSPLPPCSTNSCMD